MRKQKFSFLGGDVECLFDHPFDRFLAELNKKYVLITDQNVYNHHREKFPEQHSIILPAGETVKTQATVDQIIQQLLVKDVDKSSMLIGVGGGVISDIVGYTASIYKRGTDLTFFPTTILGMVDAAIGGKNGVDVGLYKNMVGTVYQPSYVVYDYNFLQSLPYEEWINGFAEIIKHACIRDKEMFVMLENESMTDIKTNRNKLADLIERNVDIKMNVVTHDEFEKADRKLLNFGHTIGHAIEKLHEIPHGHAVSIGIVAACALSEKINNLHFEDALRIVKLLTHYQLPVNIETDHAKVFDVLKRDKKREGGCMHFVVLDKIGMAHAQPVSMEYLNQQLPELI